jgi:alpha-amylase
MYVILSAVVVFAVAQCGGCASDSNKKPSAEGVQPSSDAFVHLFEWSWSDIAQECEQWLGPKGFTAVQVSPPNDHISGGAWWTRYQPVTYELISRSGDENAFKDMVQRCGKVGVGIYADAVINHIASGSGTSIGGKQYGSRATPIYGPQDMHHGGDMGSNCQVSNYADKHNVQYCDLVGLPDLCTSCDYVQKTVSDYINNMADIGIAGFRIDAAKHQDAGELGQLLSRVKNKKLYMFTEVIGAPGEAVTTSMYTSLGHVTEFGYPSKLAPNFQQDGKLQYLKTFGESWGLMKTGDAVVFLDNHDTQRGGAELTYKNGKLYELASVFMLAHPYGYPKVMSSYYFNDHDQGPPSSPVHTGSSVACGGAPSLWTKRNTSLESMPSRYLLESTSGRIAGASSANNTASAPLDGPWVCEHRWTAVANMVAWRKSAGSNSVSNFQAVGGDTIGFCRGSAACVALNRGSSTWEVTLKFSLPAGEYCNVIQSDDTSSCPTISVTSDGSAKLQVPPLGAVALHVGKKKVAEIMV